MYLLIEQTNCCDYCFNRISQVGLNCSNWNNTGPTLPDDPGCVAVDKRQDWCYCREPGRKVLTKYLVRKLKGDPTVEGPGMCTSLVAEEDQGRIFHGRNLDWNVSTHSTLSLLFVTDVRD